MRALRPRGTGAGRRFLERQPFQTQQLDGLGAASLTLVRPDRHVAWTGTLENLADMAKVLAEFAEPEGAQESGDAQRLH